MNAYYQFNASTLSARNADLNAGRYSSQKNLRLTEPQMTFLNSDACRDVNPYSSSFWSDLQEKLTTVTQEAKAFPKAADYRCALEPHLLRRVYLTAASWYIRDVADGRIRLLLKDVRLSGVCGGWAAAPRAATDHMNIWVSAAWFNLVIPAQDEPLVLSGVLHEYAGVKQVRNIGIWPVLVMPLSRKCGGVQECDRIQEKAVA